MDGKNKALRFFLALDGSGGSDSRSNCFIIGQRMNSTNWSGGCVGHVKVMVK
jgi:hypothetical protein